MGYQGLLGWSLAPTIFLLIICVTNTTLMTHYWILGDWLTTHGISLATLDIANIDGLEVISTTMIVQYIPTATDAVIISSCLGLFAGIVCILAWKILRKPDMDTDYNLPRRRFWVGFAFLTLLSSFGSALATLIIHYTKKGTDPFGCTTTTISDDDTLAFCTREMAACNYIPELKRIWTEEWGQEWDESPSWSLPLACNEARAVKWMQVVLMLTCVAIMAMLGCQAWIRRKTRDERLQIGQGNEVGQDSHQLQQWQPGKVWK